jgi:hypothetical protein
MRDCKRRVRAAGRRARNARQARPRSRDRHRDRDRDRDRDPDRDRAQASQRQQAQAQYLTAPECTTAPPTTVSAAYSDRSFESGTEK